MERYSFRIVSGDLLNSIDHLRSQTDFSVSFVNTTHFGLHSLHFFFASKVLNMVPLDLKDLNNAEMFKSDIRKWEPRQSECTFCLAVSVI